MPLFHVDSRSLDADAADAYATLLLHAMLDATPDACHAISIRYVLSAAAAADRCCCCSCHADADACFTCRLDARAH